MCRAHELNLWLLSAPRVFIIFEALLSIDEVINGTSPPGPSHGVNQTKHGACELAVSFLGCSNFYTIPPKLYGEQQRCVSLKTSARGRLKT